MLRATLLLDSKLFELHTIPVLTKLWQKGTKYKFVYKDKFCSTFYAHMATVAWSQHGLSANFGKNSAKWEKILHFFKNMFLQLYMIISEKNVLPWNIISKKVLLTTAYKSQKPRVNSYFWIFHTIFFVGQFSAAFV
jgi:hypothetical protein